MKQGAVTYVAAEAGRSIVNRVAAFKVAHGLEGAALPLAAVVSPIDLCHANAGDVDRLVDCIREAGSETPQVLVVIDTLSRALAGGNENGPDDMGAFVKSIDRIRDELSCHVAVVHHCGKEHSKGARGHSLLRCAVDSEIEITRDDATGISIARITKQRDGLSGETVTFRLDQVELGSDEDGDPVTSCVLREVAEQSESRNLKSRLAAGPKRALDLLNDAIARHGEIPPANEYIPRDKPCLRENRWRECCYAGQISESKNQSAKQKAFKRAADVLLVAGRVGKWGDWVWVV